MLRRTGAGCPPARARLGPHHSRTGGNPVYGQSCEPLLIQSLPTVQHLRQVRRENGRHIDFRPGSAEAIPLGDGAVSVAVSIGTIEHIEDDGAFIRELARVVRPGGRLIMYTPQNRMGRIPIWPWHIREYSIPWFKTVVNSYFEIERVMGWQNGVVTPDDERGDGMFLIASRRAR